MSKVVTATEAKNNFGEMIKWAKENEGAIYVKQYGEPAVVILKVDEYENLKRDSERLRRQKIVEEIQRIKGEAWEQLPNIVKSDDRLEAYLAAGMSKEAARELVEFDRKREQSTR